MKFSLTAIALSVGLAGAADLDHPAVGADFFVDAAAHLGELRQAVADQRVDIGGRVVEQLAFLINV